MKKDNFENVVVGRSNSLAVAAAKEVAAWSLGGLLHRVILAHQVEGKSVFNRKRLLKLLV